MYSPLPNNKFNCRRFASSTRDLLRENPLFSYSILYPWLHYAVLGSIIFNIFPSIGIPIVSLFFLILTINANSYLGLLLWYGTACLVQWLARVTAIQEVPSSNPGYTLEIFLEVQSLEQGQPSLVRTIGQLLAMRSSEIWLRKLKLRLRDKALLTTMSPVMPSGSNHFSRSWLFGAVMPRI